MVPFLKASKVWGENNIKRVSRKTNQTSPGGMPPIGAFAKPLSVDRSLDARGAALGMWMLNFCFWCRLMKRISNEVMSNDVISDITDDTIRDITDDVITPSE